MDYPTSITKLFSVATRNGHATILAAVATGGLLKDDYDYTMIFPDIIVRDIALTPQGGLLVATDGACYHVKDDTATIVPELTNIHNIQHADILAMRLELPDKEACLAFLSADNTLGMYDVNTRSVVMSDLHHVRDYSAWQDKFYYITQ